MAVKKIKIAIVEWVDACADTKWRDKGETLKVADCISVGILLEKPSRKNPQVSLCINHDGESDGMHSTHFSIPVGCIRKIKTMEVNMAAHPRKPKKSRKKTPMKKRQPRKKKGGRRR